MRVICLEYFVVEHRAPSSERCHGAGRGRAHGNEAPVRLGARAHCGWRAARRNHQLPQPQKRLIVVLKKLNPNQKTQY